MSNPLEHMSKIQDLVDLHDFMDSEELAQAMELAVKCVAKPDIPAAEARKALMKMQALAMQFRLQALTYTFVHRGKAGTEENAKKNVYLSASDQCHNMAQTLKYLAREQF